MNYIFVESVESVEVKIGMSQRNFFYLIRCLLYNIDCL